MKKELTAREMQALSIKSQKSNPNYLKIRKEVSNKGNETKRKLAIRRAIAYLIKNGYRVVGNVISK